MHVREIRPDAWTDHAQEFWGHRALDVVVAAAGLIFFGPLILLLAVLIKIDSRGPVFFGHERIGRNGRIFPCLKLRSMVVEADKRLKELLENDANARLEWTATHKLKNDPRITRLGAFLRRSSLDELPQFINILRGEMALVGPRPIVAAEVAFYGDYFESYTSVRPGVTGLWQISGRNDTTYAERVALDVSYVRQRTFMLDVRIILGTIPAVLLRRGSY